MYHACICGLRLPGVIWTWITNYSPETHKCIWIILTSCFCHQISLWEPDKHQTSKHHSQSPKRQSSSSYYRQSSLWLMSQRLRVTDCKRIQVKQPLANFHRLDNRKRKHSLNEQVLCVVEWSCDMHVVGWRVKLLRSLHCTCRRGAL